MSLKRPTINDVAADCGVSRATVSLVLRDSPQIGEVTKARVRASMVRLGYVYNRRAADMRSQQSRMLGLVVTNVRNPYFAELTMAIEEAAHDAGYTLVQGYSRDDVSRQRTLLESMTELRVDGLILLPAGGSAPEDLAPLATAGVPHVLITRSVPGYTADYVGADNIRAGRLIGEHLAALKVRSVAFLGGAHPSSSRDDRLKGVRAGLKEAGVVVSKGLSIAAVGEESGADLLDVLLKRGDCPDAIVAYNDMYAFGILYGLRDKGIEPGRDVAVASFDDVPDAVHQTPSLTSAAGHPELVGAKATALLLERLIPGDGQSRRILIKPELLHRDSTSRWRERTAR